MFSPGMPGSSDAQSEPVHRQTPPALDAAHRVPSRASTSASIQADGPHAGRGISSARHPPSKRPSRAFSPARTSRTIQIPPERAGA